jgi:hypothetical protein
MSGPVLREFRYRLNPWQYAVLLPLAAGGAGAFLYFAICPPSGPVTVEGLELTPTQCRVVMAVLAAIAPVGVASLALGLISSLLYPGRIALTADSIILPKPKWWGTASGDESMELRFSDIRSAQVMPFVARTVHLRITHHGGRVSIFSNMLPSRQEFDLLAQLVITALDR